jgi:PAS domain S-box-containing protein
VRSGSSEAGVVESAYESYFEEMPVFVTVLDPDLRIVDANRCFRERFGGGIGRHCWAVCRGQTEKCPGCVVEETFLTGEKKSSEETFHDDAGRAIPVIVRTAPLRDSTGRVVRVVQTSADISERAQLRGRLTSLGLLISSISHEIKGVLATLDGGIYIVNSGFRRDDQDRLQEGWDIVQRNIDQMRNLVLHILCYAKDRELEFSSIDAAPFAEEIVVEVEYRADALGVELERNFDPGVDKFEADESALRAVLISILENALDACQVDTSKQEHSVSFGLSRGGDNVIFTVLDNGIGMDRETREKVFDPLPSPNRAEETGLSLSISNKIVRQHGGSLSVNSTPGVGSSFTLRIPRNLRDMRPVPPDTGSGNRVGS